jgi:hypothetical protein
MMAELSITTLTTCCEFIITAKIHHNHFFTKVKNKMFDRRKDNLPVQTDNERRTPILTEDRMQLIWRIASQQYINRLQKNGAQNNWVGSD